MRINNKNFGLFHASVVRFAPALMEINNNLFEAESRYMPTLGSQMLSAQNRVLTLDFTNEDDISDFVAECSKDSTIELDDGFLYRCLLSGTPSVNEDGYCAYTVEIPLRVLKQKPLIELNVKNDEEVIIEGNAAAECKYRISVDSDTAKITVDGVTVTDLKAKDVLIVDGIEKLVYMEANPAKSAFDKTNLTTFPKLYPGKHVFKVDGTATIKVSYYPTFY